MDTNRLKVFKNYQRNENRKKVLNAIAVLKEGRPSQIFILINQQSEEDTKNYFSEKVNKISTSEEFEKKKKDLSISLKTVKNILKELHQENVIVHKKGGFYSFNEFISNNKFLIFPNHFGESMIYSIGNFFPATIEKSLEEFVNRFGLFVIFVFLRLIYFKNESGNVTISYTENEIDEWLKDAIPLKLMFELFTDLYFNNKANTKTINLKILNGLNNMIKLNHNALYLELEKNMTENKKYRYESDQRRKKMESEISKLEQDKRREKIFKSYNQKPFKLTPDRFKVYGRVIPKNWYKQLAKLAKESE